MTATFLLSMLILAISNSAQSQTAALHTLPVTLAQPGSPVLPYRSGIKAAGEGPVADRQGNMYYNEMNNFRTMRKAFGSDTAYLWRTAKDITIGMWLDTENHLIICQSQAIVRVKTGPRFDNINDTLYKRNQPGANFNDITGDSKDNFFFTNNYGGSVFFRNSITKQTKEVLSNIAGPNGIEWDEERRVLYLCEAGGAHRIFSYSVAADFTLSAAATFVTPPSGTDGFTLDALGNLYAAGNNKAVYVYSPEGKELGQIPLAGSGMNHLAFGDADFKTLYFATEIGLFKMRMNVKGYKPGNSPLALEKTLGKPVKVQSFSFFSYRLDGKRILLPGLFQ